jgi:hypothetical protein
MTTNREVSSRVLKELRIMWQIFARGEADRETVLVYAADLADYPEPQILDALSRCRRELRTFPTIADVLARIDDQRPGAEEAWAMIPKDEEGSVVWTEEMRDAYAIARQLMADDPVAARMAFREAYLRLVAEARAKRRPTVWVPSLGLNRDGRTYALQAAVQARRITAARAALLLPDAENQPTRQAQIAGPAEDGHRPESLEHLREIADRILAHAPERLRTRERIRRSVRSSSDDVEFDRIDKDETERLKREAMKKLEQIGA